MVSTAEIGKGTPGYQFTYQVNYSESISTSIALNCAV